MTLPNQLTVLRMVLSPVAVFLLLSPDIVAKRIGTGVFIIASLTDWYDGHFARKYGYVTEWGKFLDPLADKILISSMLLCFVLLNYIRMTWVVIIVMRDLIITALRGYMMMYDKPIAASRLAKWKTFTQVGLVYTVLIFIHLNHFHETNPARFGFANSASFTVIIDNFAQFVALVTVITGLIYLYQNRKPLIELFVKFFKFIIPYGVVSEINSFLNDSNGSDESGNKPGQDNKNDSKSNNK